MNVDVAGLGNAIMDALVRIPDEELLRSFELTRGQMHPVDHPRWSEIYEAARHHGVEVQPGGSCANTIATLAMLGTSCVFSGQLGDDEFGTLYAEKMEDCCGSHALKQVAGGHTGKCLSLISTQDAERTMLTDLGCSVNLDSLEGFDAIIRSSRLLHLTGYLFLGGPMADTARQALELGREAGVPISIDVADPFVISLIKDDLVGFIKDYASVVFLNEEEAKALTGQEAEEALETVASWVDVAVVKIGSRGSLIRQGDRSVRVGIHSVEALDTTGAGDAYAAGFLHGWLKGWSLEQAGDLAARVAALTVAQVGAVCRDHEALKNAAVAAQQGEQS